MGERLTPVHQLALELRIPVRTPDGFANPVEQAAFAALEPDVAVVVAYGIILRQPILAAPPFGCFNVHPSLLPRWRGAAPIERTILAGDVTTGVTIMRMNEGLDSGPICLSRALALDDRTTAGALRAKLATVGAALMVEVLKMIERGEIECKPQPDEGITYARKLDKAEARIDFDRPAHIVLRHIHAYSPRPGAFAEIDTGGDRLRLKILEAEAAAGSGTPGCIIDRDFTVACRDGAVRPVLVQRPGKTALSRNDFLRGLAIAPGMMLH
jgi:methionyl-tRNA formyltransferase